jgi:hypothetical protein
MTAKTAYAFRKASQILNRPDERFERLTYAEISDEQDDYNLSRICAISLLRCA